MKISELFKMCLLQGHKVNLKEHIGIEGIFKLQVWEGDRLIEEIEDRNLIVNAGKETLAILLASGNSNRVVTKIGFGTGTSNPVVGDTDLSNKFVKNLGTISYPTQTSVRWEWSLESGEGNGLTITEYGLFTTNTTLFSRKVVGSIAKIAGVRLTGTWTINFS